jgi:hypothetical protein
MYESLSSLHASSFNILKNDAFKNHQDLQFTTPKINDLEELKSIL